MDQPQTRMEDGPGAATAQQSLRHVRESVGSGIPGLISLLPWAGATRHWKNCARALDAGWEAAGRPTSLEGQLSVCDLAIAGEEQES
jgi:hypothetical protein